MNQQQQNHHQYCLFFYFFLHTRYGYLRFHPEIENLILQRLSYRVSHVRAVHWLYWNSRTWSSSDVIVILNWRHYIMSYHSVFRNFWEPLLNMKGWYLMVSKKIYKSCEEGIDKSVPRDHRLSSLGKPSDAKR